MVSDEGGRKLEWSTLLPISYVMQISLRNITYLQCKYHVQQIQNPQLVKVFGVKTTPAKTYSYRYLDSGLKNINKGVNNSHLLVDHDITRLYILFVFF